MRSQVFGSLFVSLMSASLSAHGSVAASSAHPVPSQRQADTTVVPCSNQTPPRPAEDVMRAALSLLPEQPAYVSLIDVEAQDDNRIREALRPLEAFILAGRNGVYVNVHGATLRRAVTAREERICRFDLHVLAAIVWHEMAHIAGADEAGAQAKEEELWRQFLRDGRVDAEPGLRQMQIYGWRSPR